MQIVKFPHRRNAAQHHFEKRHARRVKQRFGESRIAARYMASRQVQNVSRTAPRATLGAASDDTLEGVGVRIHQAGQHGLAREADRPA